MAAFAMQAMIQTACNRTLWQRIKALFPGRWRVDGPHPREVAVAAYVYADAMIAQRGTTITVKEPTDADS